MDSAGKLTLAHVHAGANRCTRAAGVLREEQRPLRSCSRTSANRRRREARAGEHRRAEPGPRPSPPGRRAGGGPDRRRLVQPQRARPGDARRRHARGPQRRAVRGGGGRARLRRAPVPDREDRRRLRRVAGEHRGAGEGAGGRRRDAGEHPGAGSRSRSRPTRTRASCPPSGRGIDEMLKDANTRLQELDGVEGERGLRPDGRGARGVRRLGRPAGGRLAQLRPGQRLVLGSTSDYLERHARCSLLVLPRGPPGTTTPGAAGGRGER